MRSAQSVISLHVKPYSMKLFVTLCFFFPSLVWQRTVTSVRCPPPLFPPCCHHQEILEPSRSHLSPPLSSRTLSACQKVRTPPLIFIVFRAPLPLLYMPCACSLSDVFDGHLVGSTDSQVKEKSTMKAILANFLPGNSYNPIPFPL